jgi:hypothetical protein
VDFTIRAKDARNPWPGFSQLFFSFLTFLLLFAQRGGAIYNYGTLTVKYGSFTNNSADAVCVIAPTVTRDISLACYVPGRELESKLAPLPHRFRTGSAPLPHRFRTASAPLPHRFRTGSTLTLTLIGM